MRRSAMPLTLCGICNVCAFDIAICAVLIYDHQFNVKKL